MILLASAFLIIAGCGGGGGGVRRDSPTPVTEPSPDMPDPSLTMPEPGTSESELRQEFAEHPEFRNQPALEQVKAHYAYARGATGEGIVIGIIDDGVDPGHPVFEGKLLPESYHLDGYNPDFEFCASRDADGICEEGPPSHGTLVAGVIAAHRQTSVAGDIDNVVSIHGVAFDADLISVGIPFGDPPDYYEPIDLGSHGGFLSLDQEFAGIAETLNPSVTAVNLSFGFSGIIDDYTEADIRTAFPLSINAIAQTAVPASERTIYVWAAGNAKGEMYADGSIEDATSVEILPGLPVHIRELRGHSLAVVATNQSGEIAGFSNRCGIAGDFCLAAPGVNVTGPIPNSYCPPGQGNCYSDASGTSLAAPIVTGGIALLAQRYRGQLGNDEIVARLLQTADKTGIYANADVYGQGFLDLDAATRPVGETRLIAGRSLSGPSALEQVSAISMGPAFGDAVSRGLALREIAGFDELDAPFFRPLGHYVRHTNYGIRLEDRLRVFRDDPSGALWETDSVEFRTRIEHAPDFFGVIPASPRLGSLSFTQRSAGNEIFFGLRSHPGWHVGLHAAGTGTGLRAGLISPGTFTDDAAFANPYLSFARDGAVAGLSMPVGKGALRIATFHGAAQYGERRDPDTSHSTGALAEYRFGNGLQAGMAFQAGWLTEPRRLAGSRPSGAFGELGADTGFLGVSAHHRFNERWVVLGSVHAGLSRVRLENPGMLHDLSSLWSSTFAFGIIGKNIGRARDRLALRLSQPLRVEAGDVRLNWVSGRTRDRRVFVEETVLELAPSGRQLDIEMTYSRPWKNGRAHLAALFSRDAGHVREQKDIALLMQYRRSY